jgi:CHAT domain-containing protein
LILVPDGPLHYVPFEALVTAPPSGPYDYGAASYLADHHELEYVPGIQWLPPPKSGRVDLGHVLAVDGGAPGAAFEVEKLRAALPTGALTVLQGPGADEATTIAAAAGKDVVHFAVHALADDSDPLASHLRLSAAAGSDGFLHAAEIATAFPPVDLVVLSACETLAGPLLEGEGLFGLARSFLATGSGTVVASRWPTGAAAADFMATLYGGLARGESLPASMREARMALRRRPETAHPFFWAGFVLLSGPG